MAERYIGKGENKVERVGAYSDGSAAKSPQDTELNGKLNASLPIEAWRQGKQRSRIAGVMMPKPFTAVITHAAVERADQ